MTLQYLKLLSENEKILNVQTKNFFGNAENKQKSFETRTDNNQNKSVKWLFPIFCFKKTLLSY